MSEKKKVKVKVFRFDPAVDKEPHYDTFEVEAQEGCSVYNALEYIVEKFDPTLAFYASCRIGACMGCLARVNGKVVRTCTTMLEEDVVIEPVKEENVLRDLVMKGRPLPEDISPDCRR